MKVLILTNMYPHEANPAYGTFVYDQVHALIDEGVEIDVLFINGKQNLINYPIGVMRLWKQLIFKKYDLIHAHHAITGYIARMQICCPTIVTYHGGEVKDYVPKWLRVIARFGPNVFDRIFVVNKAEKAILKNNPKVSVIPCGVDLNTFNPMPRDEARAKLNLAKDAKLVLWAGEYWQYEKRYELVEEAIDLLKDECPDADLVLVSGRPHSEVPLFMNACDVLILASRSEGSPMVIKEALACNLPIISTDVGDVAERIAGVEGCAIVAPDAIEMKAKLLEVLRDPQRTNGREMVSDLSSKNIAKRIINIYSEISQRN